MTTFKDAAIEAIENADYWMGGAVVVREDENDDYTAIPAAHLTDASYTGSADVVLDLTGGLDSTGYSLEDGTAEEIYELLCC